jgi:hypothetical protein
MKEGEPAFTPAQKENLRRHAYVNLMADAIAKDVAEKAPVQYNEQHADAADALVVKPSPTVVAVFRRVAKSVYQDEIVPDANPAVRALADQVQHKRHWK